MNIRQKKKQTNRKPFDKVHSAARYEMAKSIEHRVVEAGVEPNTRAIWSYTRWLAHNLSNDDWYKETLIACGLPRELFSKPLSECQADTIEFLKTLTDMYGLDDESQKLFDDMILGGYDLELESKEETI